MNTLFWLLLSCRYYGTGKTTNLDTPDSQSETGSLDSGVDQTETGESTDFTSVNLEWNSSQGSNNYDYIYGGIKTTDGGYIAVGATQENDMTNALNVVIIKINSQGELEWMITEGMSNFWDLATSVVEVSDGYIIAGAFNSGSTQKTGLLKLNKDGTTVWQKTFYHTGIGLFKDIKITLENKIVLTGYSHASEPGFLHTPEASVGFIILLDLDGNQLWKEELEISEGTKVLQTQDGNFAILSTSLETESNLKKATIILTDSTGNTQWSKHLGPIANDAHDFLVTTDGSFLISGQSKDNSSNWDCSIIKSNSEGEHLWTKKIGQPRGYDSQYIIDTCYAITQTQDGGFLVAGGTGEEDQNYSQNTHPDGASDEVRSYLVRLNGDGEPQWERTFSGNSQVVHTTTRAIETINNDGIILFNETTSIDRTDYNFGFMKLSTDQLNFSPQ